MPRTKVILNPIAGRGYGARAEPDVRRLLTAEGVEFDLARSDWPGHAIELAQQAAAEGYEVVVAAGGDGTSHEVVNGLMAAQVEGHHSAVGALALGSGSDFAHTIGVKPDLEEACRQVAHGQPRPIDLGRVSVDGGEPRYFDNTLGLGFDGVVTLEARKIKRLRGMALYLPVVLKTVFVSFKPPRVTVRYDDKTMVMTTLMVVVANGPREGGGFFVAPEAKPDDGLFDLCLVEEIGKLGMLGIIPHFMAGTHVGRDPVTMARARNVTITSPDDLPVHCDGEMLCTAGHRLDIEMVPGCLRAWS
jgi:YegS/Rv2252/BmrU family lipid kinase